MPIIPTLWCSTHGWRAIVSIDVVAVEALQRLEEVERAARAAGAAHVDVDDREAHQVGEDRDAALRAGRVGVAVARVLDQRRRRAGRDLREADADREGVRHVLRRMDVDASLVPSRVVR